MATPDEGSMTKVRRRHLLAAVASAAILINGISSLGGNSPSPIASRAATPATLDSLKGKTDEELLQLVVGRKSSVDQQLSQEYEEDRVRFSSLDRLWEMDPRDAAVAFVSDYVSKEAKGLTFKIDNRDAHPPKRGEIGIRWISGNYYAAPEQGVTILKHDGYNSTLLVSEVEIVGRPSKEEIERAVMKTDSHPLPRLVAQQTYEILWWLRHVHPVVEPRSGRSAAFSSVDDFGRLWMKPDGPVIEKAVFGEPCGECAAGNVAESCDTFAATLIRRLIERSGIKRRYPVPKIGRYVDPDPDAKFLHAPPPDGDDPEAVKRWIGRLADILRNPKRQYLCSDVMDMLVPISNPLRYKDARIDGALLEVLHRGVEAAANFKPMPEMQELDPSRFPDQASFEKELKLREEKRKKESDEERLVDDLRITAMTAAEKLGSHDAVDAFPELLSLGKESVLAKFPWNDPPNFRWNGPLIGAASLAGGHPELRSSLIEFLKSELSAFADKSELPSYLLEATWRADLRYLTPSLEQLAGTSPPPGKDTADQSGNRFHEARVILMAWREHDPLTKTKLDIMLSGYIGGGKSIPAVLRAEFEALSKQDQLTVRNFVNWTRTVDVPWSRRYIENIFTPHTPRPDILIER